tara:strand:- start:703 stop:1461 length:759 start_codon:yes stop_codon:yes gene_type:complete
MEREDGFMDFGLFKKVVDDSPGLEHLCMHNWGEPLLHKDIFEMFDYAHEAGVRWIVMNTNGTLLNDKMIDRILDSPLSIIRFSIDGSAENFKRVRGVELHKIEANIKKLKEKKDLKGSNLSMGVVFTVEEESAGETESYAAYWQEVVDHVRFQPKLVQSPRSEICPELFGKDYGKLVVLWDGTVIPCCVDYNATLTLGNAHENKVMDLWNEKAIDDLRVRHKSSDFPTVCENCNECATSKAPKRFFYDAGVV